MDNRPERTHAFEKVHQPVQISQPMSEVCCNRDGYPKRSFMIIRIVREPLVHFLALGAILFGIYVVANHDSRKSSKDFQIFVKQGRIQQLCEAFTAQTGRSPTEDELAGIVETYIREEILCREAMHLGLDRNDTIIRRRLAQKMQFIYEDMAPNGEPTDEVLENYMNTHAGLYHIPEKVGFTHIYFSADRRGEKGAEKAANDLLHKIRVNGLLKDQAVDLGDPFVLQYEYPQRSQQEVNELFGTDFAHSLFKVRSDQWEGPFSSSYGIHLVRIFERIEGRMPSLSEVRDKVKNDWRYAQQQEANATAYQRLRERYEVVFEKEESSR